MKLKKIASLALAGVMAVSMLAGCGTGTTAGNDGATVETGANTSAVATFNDTQSEFNKVKVTFSSSASLDAALAKAVKANPTGTEAQIGGLIKNIIGTNYVAKENIGGDSALKAAVAKGDSDTYVTVLKYEKSKTGCLSEDAAVKAAAVAADGVIKDLDANAAITAGKDTYVAYEYTGEVSVVTSETSYGDVCYYVAITATKTGVEKTLTEKDA